MFLLLPVEVPTEAQQGEGAGLRRGPEPHHTSGEQAPAA